LDDAGVRQAQQESREGESAEAEGGRVRNQSDLFDAISREIATRPAVGSLMSGVKIKARSP
jgi:hypothetical protein